MTWIPGLKPANYGASVEELENRSGRPLYKKAVLEWSQPQILKGTSFKVSIEENKPLLYVIMRDHGRMKRKNRISYVGLSTRPKNRFYNHPKARGLADMRGDTSLSYAYLAEDPSSRIESPKKALEDIEHILIWALWEYLRNEQKVYILPGMGSKAGDAWHIINEGFRFSWQMPEEIVYPWMLVKSGKDRSLK